MLKIKPNTFFRTMSALCRKNSFYFLLIHLICTTSVLLLAVLVNYSFLGEITFKDVGVFALFFIYLAASTTLQLGTIITKIKE